MNFSAVLLAGGASSRMGRDKSTLYWKGSTLLLHQAEILRQSGAHQLLLSGPAEQSSLVPGFALVQDSENLAGPAAALADVWRATDASVLVVLAVDVPRIPPDYLRDLALGALQQERSVVPVRGGRYEPLVAAWHRSCLAEFFGAAGRSLQNICANLVKMDLLTVREVTDGESQLFENINTPADYERLGGWR